ncbi:MAG: histone-like protein [Candidatus Micrarchaeia archaeon]|jgi:histone H3/H4
MPISVDSVKKLVKKYTGSNITEDGAAEIARFLEKKAREIAKYAVKNAKKEKRNKVTKEDIESYIFKKEEL